MLLRVTTISVQCWVAHRNVWQKEGHFKIVNIEILTDTSKDGFSMYLKTETCYSFSGTTSILISHVISPLSFEKDALSAVRIGLEFPSIYGIYWVSLIKYRNRWISSITIFYRNISFKCFSFDKKFNSVLQGRKFFRIN